MRGNGPHRARRAGVHLTLHALGIKPVYTVNILEFILIDMDDCLEELIFARTQSLLPIVFLANNEKKGGTIRQVKHKRVSCR